VRPDDQINPADADSRIIASSMNSGSRVEIKIEPLLAAGRDRHRQAGEKRELVPL
jgi:hypothetical protein